MATMRIRKGDTVRVIAGGHKGTITTVIATDQTTQTVTLQGIGEIKRKVKPSQLNPRGTTKDIHRGIHISNVVLVNGEKQDRTRINYQIKADGTKIRRATQLKNKEIK